MHSRWCVSLGNGLIFGILLLFCTDIFAQTYPLTVTKQAYKSGQIVTNVNPGDTVRYVIEYTAKSFATTANLTNITLYDAMSTHMVLPGSVLFPNSWVPAPTGSTVMGFSSPLLTSGINTSLTPATASALRTASAGGDGFKPIIYRNANNTIKRFFEIYHHKDPGSGQINCQDMETGLNCSGYPKSLSATFSSGTEGLGTPRTIHTVIVKDKLYFPAFRTGPKWGIGCWDLITNNSCSFIELATGSDGWAYGAQGGVVSSSVSPNVLFMTYGGRLYCYDLTSASVCGAPQQVIPEKILAGTLGPNNNVTSDILSLGKYIFIAYDRQLACYDVSTLPGKKCASGWPLGSAEDNGFVTIYPVVDSSGDADGACLLGFHWNDRTSLQCWNVNGQSINPPGFFSSRRTYHSMSAFNHPGSTKVYYAEFNTNPWGGDSSTLCWDYEINAACIDFIDGGSGSVTGVRRWERPNYDAAGTSTGVVGQTMDYGYAYDQGCMFGLGDSGLLWSFDPETGKSPCNKTDSVITVPDPKLFCDGNTHNVNWDHIEFINPPATLQSVSINVYDAAVCKRADVSNCTPISGGSQITSNRPTTLPWKVNFPTKFSQTTYPSIRFKITYTFQNNSPPTNIRGFELRTMYTVDGSTAVKGQFCLDAKVLHCPASEIDNLATLEEPSRNVLGRGLNTLRTITTDISFSDSSVGVDIQGVMAGNGVVFKPSYKRALWGGQLTAFRISQNGVIDESAPLWEASQQIPAHANRKIMTSSTVGVGNGISFEWDNLNVVQRAYFGHTETIQRRTINYFRGDRSYEVQANTDNMYRRRTSTLGDIVHSTPLHYGGAVYVQANDGMLHAFDATTGVERFAYIPNRLLSLLPSLSLVSYKHQYFMDGQMAVTVVNNRPLLIASSGGMNPSIVGIDISDLNAPPADMVKWELTSPFLGRANGPIRIATFGDGTKVAEIANGLGSMNHTAALILVNLGSGSLVVVDTAVGDAANPNGLTGITSQNGNYAYGGDIQGNLWRFSEKSSPSSNLNILKLFAAGASRPITAPPAVTEKVKAGAGLTSNWQMVYFGTGKPIDRNDFNFNPTAPDEVAQQSVYGIYDMPNNNSQVLASELVTQTITTATRLIPTAQGTLNTPVREISSSPVNYPSKKGWVINLPTTGERLITSPDYDRKYVNFTTVVPSLSACMNASVEGWFMSVDSRTGGSTKKQVINAKLTAADNSNVYSGIKVSGTTANITKVTGDGPAGGKIRFNIISNADNDRSGNKATEVINTRTSLEKLERNSWQELY